MAGKSNVANSPKVKAASSMKTTANAKHSSKKPGGTGGGLSQKEMDIVCAAGKLYAAGIHQPSRDMVQALAKQGKTPEAFKKHLGSLKKKGYLEYPNAKSLALTDDKGVALVGDVVMMNSDEEVLTNEIYHDQVVRELLSKKAFVIFKAITDGKVHIRLDVARRLGYDMNKLSGYDKDLSKMKTLGFLEKDKETMQLTDKCFPFGRPNSEE